MAKKGPSTIQDRLHRIEGQVRGVEKLVENGEDTQKILIQIEAIISSLQSTKLELIKSDMKNALMAQLDSVVSMLK
ncbi:MAG TPA: metal-sensing transcriptional repressor [Candidatus Dojkabacteria bacterium]|nr:metal-sensing transcriptional repressor [Candidatus Dojkabacteria bacterium]